MKKIIFPSSGVILCLALFLASGASAIPQNGSPERTDYEKSIDAVVRNKQFYKTGKIEITPTAGFMPYDSLMNHYTIGGRALWHLSDHYAWEIADVQYSLPSVTGYTTDLVKSKGLTGGVQVQKLKLLASSNFVASPLYGKVRFLGASVIHFDFYVVGGLGFAAADVANYSLSGGNVNETILSTGGKFMFDFGLGIKLFLNSAMGLVVDFRDYVTLSNLYGSTNPKSNFSVNFGLSFFLPNFG